MSEIEIEEYMQRYANMHCGGDAVVAKEHKIVQAVAEELREEK